ncbi:MULTISPECIES: hypothetical protein [Actinosynnema]|uniref:hypothetical protein n=1 Tax=Actinosynnema TaxID=40566 RepID=UPI0020A5446B|nr:hypothetical protein [Actinosynnema pretiosum]MCP2092172.1 hypothetical protein [Actinosynnema pretiosum]
MRLAGGIPLDDLLTGLARSRPVFHSEADLQHALAWQAHLADPLLRVRLEVRPAPTSRERLDLLLHRPDLGLRTAVEIKYWKKRWTGVVDDEPFDLANQGAHDIRRYDFAKDVARVERFTAANRGWSGLVLLLSNDDLDWRPPTSTRPTAADAFRVHEGTRLTGELAWSDRAGPGTTRGREAPIALTGDYRTTWRDYALLDHRPGGRVRALAVEVHPEATR